MAQIKVTCSSVDGCSATRSFKTLARAQRYAQHYLGETPELGRHYAVSDDGVCTVRVVGVTLIELFPKLALMFSDTVSAP